MIFIINGRIKFNEYEGTLEDVADPLHIQPLVDNACRLLAIFVRNNEMLIKRRQLLEEVWEERGLKGTNGNLNNYISLLRRHLAQFGETELIITYPRKGFKLVAKKVTRHPNDEIKLEKEDVQCVEEQVTPPEKTKHQTEKKRHGGGCRLSNGIARMKEKKWFVMIFLISTVGAVLTINHYGRGKKLNDTQYDNCQIYTMGMNSQSKETITNTVKSNINCQRKTKVYYLSLIHI